MRSLWLNAFTLVLWNNPDRQLFSIRTLFHSSVVFMVNISPYSIETRTTIHICTAMNLYLSRTSLMPSHYLIEPRPPPKPYFFQLPPLSLYQSRRPDRVGESSYTMVFQTYKMWVGGEERRGNAEQLVSKPLLSPRPNV